MSEDLRPTRAERSHRSERRRRIWGAVAVVVVLAVLVAVVVARTGDEGTPAATPSASTSPSAPAGPADLLAFSVTGAPHALLATVGRGAVDASVVLPPDLTLTMPGAGEITTEQLQQLDGSSMRIGVSNVAGAWNTHYGVMDLIAFGEAVDRLGGLNVELQDAYVTGADVFGPGQIHMTGDQVVALLRADEDDIAARWADVLTAFLAAQPNLASNDFTETDDAQAAAEMLGAGAAPAQILPTQAVGGTAMIAAQPDLDDLMTQLFGTPTPLRAEVRNGNGQPGVGESVGARLIPAGFRIVLSDNADTFDHQTTQIIAAGTENAGAAQDAKEALGIGKVIVSQVSSGLADVSVIVGQDYHG